MTSKPKYDGNILIEMRPCEAQFVLALLNQRYEALSAQMQLMRQAHGEDSPPADLCADMLDPLWYAMKSFEAAGVKSE